MWPKVSNITLILINFNQINEIEMNAPQGGVCNILTNFRPEYFLICTTRLSTEQITNSQT